MTSSFAIVTIELPEGSTPVKLQNSYFQVHDSGALLVFERGREAGPVLALARGNWNAARMET